MSMYNRELPFGTPEEFLLQEGETVKYNGETWVIDEAFRSRSKMNIKYENEVFAAYVLKRYVGLSVVLNYISQDDVPYVETASEQCDNAIIYSTNYTKMIGK